MDHEALFDLPAPEEPIVRGDRPGTAIEDTPEQIAQIAEHMHPGNGVTVEPYLAKGGRKVGYAMPIRRVREFSGFTASELERMLDGFHPPQGYVLVDKHPGLRVVCDRLLSSPAVRETTPAPAP